MSLVRSAGPGAGLQVLFAEPNLSAAHSASCSRVTGNQRDLGPIHFTGEDAGTKPRASGLPGEFRQLRRPGCHPGLVHLLTLLPPLEGELQRPEVLG